MSRHGKLSPDSGVLSVVMPKDEIDSFKAEASAMGVSTSHVVRRYIQIGKANGHRSVKREGLEGGNSDTNRDICRDVARVATKGYVGVSNNEGCPCCEVLSNTAHFAREEVAEGQAELQQGGHPEE